MVEIIEVILIVVMVCFLAYVGSNELLRRRLKKRPLLYSTYFSKTSAVAIGPPRIELPNSLRLKCLFPFLVDTAALNMIERAWLYLARISVWVGLGFVVYGAVFVLVAS